MQRPLLPQTLSRAAITTASFGQRAAERVKEWRRKRTAIAVIASAKGGCGKSTLTLNMAMGYIEQGLRVLVIDADTGQKTMSKWPRPAGLAGPTIVSWQTADIVDELAAVIEQYDVVLIDFAGRDDRAAARVLAIADILLSPAKPSYQDMTELGCFIEVARARNVPHLVVFNEATREVTGELAQLAAEFAQFRPYLPTAIQQLTGYRRSYAFGRSVLEYRGDHPAKQNFARVFRQIDMAIRQARARTGGRGS